MPAGLRDPTPLGFLLLLTSDRETGSMEDLDLHGRILLDDEH
jgi:hypothetical protein